MFPDVVPIQQDNVAATLDDIYERFIDRCLGLQPGIDTQTLGSAGKKLPGETSGDIDIAIDYNVLKEKWDFPEWTGKRLDEWVDLARDSAKRCKVKFAMAATVCSLRWPIRGNQKGKYVQVDLMPTPNMKMMAFGKFSQQQREGETFFNGTVRNIMLAIMARCSYHKDLTDDTHIKVLDDGTEKEVHNEYEGWTYDGNSGLHLCHKWYERYAKSGKGYQKGDWKPHASVVDSPIISSDPNEIVEMIFGKGVKPEDVDTVQKMWRAWKQSPAVKENPDLIEEVRRQIERHGAENTDMTFPDFDGEEFINEARIKKSPEEQVDEYIKSLSPEQIQTLTLRCSELLDKWGEAQGSDTVLRVRNTVGDDSRFL